MHLRCSQDNHHISHRSRPPLLPPSPLCPPPSSTSAEQHKSSLHFSGEPRRVLLAHAVTHCAPGLPLSFGPPFAQPIRLRPTSTMIPLSVR